MGTADCMFIRWRRRRMCMCDGMCVYVGGASQEEGRNWMKIGRSKIDLIALYWAVWGAQGSSMVCGKRVSFLNRESELRWRCVPGGKRIQEMCFLSKIFLPLYDLWSGKYFKLDDPGAIKLGISLKLNGFFVAWEIAIIITFQSIKVGSSKVKDFWYEPVLVHHKKNYLKFNKIFKFKPENNYPAKCGKYLN